MQMLQSRGSNGRRDGSRHQRQRRQMPLGLGALAIVGALCSSPLRAGTCPGGKGCPNGFPSFTQPASQSICTGSMIQLTVAPTDGEVFAWEFSSNGGVDWNPLTDGHAYSGTMTSTLTVNPATADEAGLYRCNVQCTGGNGCITEASLLTVDAGPTADAGGPYQACGTATVDLVGSVGNANTTLWTTDGSGEFRDASALITTYTPSSQDAVLGSVLLTLTAVNANCKPGSAESTVLVRIDPIPVVDAGGPYQGCGRSEVTVGGSAMNAATTQWTSSGSGQFEQPGDLRTIYIPSTEDVALGSVNLTLTAENSACEPALVMSQTSLTISQVEVSAGGPYNSCGAPVQITGSTSNAESLVWTTDGTGVFGDPNSIETTYTPSAADLLAGHITLTLAAENPACSPTTAASEAMLTLLDVSVGAGGPYTTCGTTPVGLAGIAANTNRAIWSSSGTGVFADATVLTTTYSPSAADVLAGEITLTLTGTAEACSEANFASHVSLTISAAPTCDAGGPYSGCGTATVSIFGSSTNATTQHWSTNGTGSFANPEALATSYLPSESDVATGIVTLTLSVSNPTCNPEMASAETSITFNQGPSCRGGGPYETCGRTSVGIIGTASNAVSTLWTTSGTGTFANATHLNTSYLPSIADVGAGGVVLTLTATNSGCQPSTAVSNSPLTIHAPPTAMAGGPYTTCSFSLVNVSGTAPGASATIWTTSGTGQFDDVHSLSTAYRPSAADVAAGSVILTITASSPGCTPASTSASSALTILKQPTVSAGGPYASCDGASVELIGTAANQSSVSWSSSGTGTFTAPSALSTTYNPSDEDLAAGDLTLTLQAAPTSPCEESASSSAQLTFGRSPTAQAGPDQSICEGQSVHLGGAATSHSAISWTGGTGFFSPNNLTLDAIYTPSGAEIAAGFVSLTLSAAPSSPCATPATDQLLVVINRLPLKSLNVESTESAVCRGGDTAIKISNSQIGVRYQLRRSPGNEAVGSPVDGNGSTINLPSDGIQSTTTFNVFATNSLSGCSQQLSTTRTISILTPTTIASQPADVSVALVAGQGPPSIGFTVAAAGTALTYQWQQSTDGGVTYADVATGSGATTAKFTTAPVSASASGTRFRCIVGGACGVVTSESAVLMVEDTDGISSEIEDRAPGGGDGNGDGIPDAQQDNVASAPLPDGTYITVVGPEGSMLASVAVLSIPSQVKPPAGLSFPVGFLSFKLIGIKNGSPAQVQVILPPGIDANTYVKFGTESANKTPHWYEFKFDGVTGAQLSGNQLLLTFVDGLRGDDDRTANGIIEDPGAVALLEALPGIQLNPACDPAEWVPPFCGQGCGLSQLSMLTGVFFLKVTNRRRHPRP